MGVVTVCSPAVWAFEQAFFSSPLSVLRGSNDAREDETQAAEKPPVAGRTGQEQVDVVKEDHEQPDDAERDHHDRKPCGARNMHRARTRGVAG